MFYAIGYYCWEIASSSWNFHNFSSGQDIRNNNASLERYWNAESNNVRMIVLALSSAEQYIFLINDIGAISDEIYHMIWALTEPLKFNLL